MRFKKMYSLKGEPNPKYEKKEKDLIKYACGYCGCKFKQVIGTFGTGRNKRTSQVICPRCGNFLKTEVKNE